MGFGWQEIDKNLDMGYIRVGGLHRGCQPAVLFDPPNFCPRTMTHCGLNLCHMQLYTVELCVRACVQLLIGKTTGREHPLVTI